jgi:ribosomal protein S18 acetylase RimI-like enzyme
MTNSEAAEIAALLNDRNELVVQYDAARVLSNADNYIYRSGEAGTVVACLELKKVQWYQFEVSHVSVALGSERQGHGHTLVQEAENLAVAKGARILQCTIRENNEASKALFTKRGFSSACKFYSPYSGNTVGVWQKVVSHAP